ncbi:hypothetical protein OAJ18_02055 [Pelagibacteraceae bacterium]|nr:hypothetical protein [Pelagibacteraceae bacterium]
MTDFKFLDKRDDNGLPLGYSINGFAYDLAEKCLPNIKNYKIYKHLTETFSEKYIDIYFKKLFYESSLPLAGQCVINNWHLKNDGKILKNKINAIGFPSKQLLKLVWPSKDFYFEINNNLRTASIIIKNKLFPYYNIWLRCKALFNLKILLKKNIENLLNDDENIVAVNYMEGHNIEKKSDLFWFKNSGINPSSVIIYFDNKKRMNKYSNDKELFFKLNSYGVKWIKMWEWRGCAKKITFIEELLKRINKSEPEDLIEKWLKTAAITLIHKIGFWYSFFEDLKVKVHIHSDEMGLSNVVRQIAIAKLGSFSIGKIRSYPTNIKGDFLGFYPNDVFFTWGKNSSSRIFSTENGMKNIITSGFPYPAESKEKKMEIEKIKKSFSQNGVKFSLMLIDANHSYNTNFGWQMMYTPEMTRFYEVLFKWFNEDSEIGIIVKSKYPAVLKDLPSVAKVIEKAKKTGRCFLVNSPEEMPNHYSSACDIAFSTGPFFPGVLIQYILTGKKGIFYDYAKLLSLEKDIYSWGKNKVFFTDLSEAMRQLKSYKENKNKNKELGDWSKKINEHDSFRDGNGGARIGSYINWLQVGFEKKLKREECLDYANKMYAQKWGEDKIIYCNK